MAYSVSLPPERKIKPAFMVKKLEGKRSQDIITFDAKGQKVTKTFEVDAGYLVKFRAGHSIRVANEKELSRLGFDQTVPLINDDGDAVGLLDNDIITDDEVA